MSSFFNTFELFSSTFLHLYSLYCVWRVFTVTPPLPPCKNITLVGINKLKIVEHIFIDIQTSGGSDLTELKTLTINSGMELSTANPNVQYCQILSHPSLY